MNINRELVRLRKKIYFSANQLKIVAMISMLIDHIALTLILNGKLYGYDEVLLKNVLTLESSKGWFILYKICRIIGRMAFPIFAFLLVEGFRHTSNIVKYIMRIGFLALLSEIPYDLMVHNRMFYYEEQNVVFAYFIALLMLVIIRILSKYSDYFDFPILMLAGIICYMLKTAYSIECILLIYVFYKLKNNWNWMMIAASGILIWSSWEKFYGLAFLSVGILYFYDGKKGELSLKTLSYVFYPLHMLILYGIVYFSYLK